MRIDVADHEDTRVSGAHIHNKSDKPVRCHHRVSALDALFTAICDKYGVREGAAGRRHGTGGDRLPPVGRHRTRDTAKLPVLAFKNFSPSPPSFQQRILRLKAYILCPQGGDRANALHHRFDTAHGS